MNSVFDFLKKLEKNNDREWFQEHKEAFLNAEKEFKQLANDVQERLQSIDELETHATKTYRIYRDVRFSKDKTPFHIHRSVSYRRATVLKRGGYYLRIQRGNSRISGGFFGPNAADLLHIRKQIQQDPEELRSIFSQSDYQNYFNRLEGDQLKTAPKGFDKEDPAIDLLRYKSFVVRHHFSDEEVMRSDFPDKVVEGFKKMRPFFDYMSEILTTDLNGVPLH